MKDAYQTLLSQPIAKALQEGDADELTVLAKHPGFYEVLEIALEKLAVGLQIDSSILANFAMISLL